VSSLLVRESFTHLENDTLDPHHPSHPSSPLD